jgi:hypothetical protein
MLIFTATFLPINLGTRTPFIPWMQIVLCCLYLYCRNHHCCQHHSLLLILLCLITAPISIVKRGVLVATSIPTTTVAITRTGGQSAADRRPNNWQQNRHNTRVGQWSGQQHVRCQLFLNFGHAAPHCF